MSDEVVPAHIRDLRAFNRFYTSVMGFLDQGLLQSRFTLTEARVLFELAQHNRVGVPELRSQVKIDAGHLSRILGRFESSGLAARARSESDGRSQSAELTEKGRQAFQTLNARSDDQARQLLATLSEGDRRRLVGSFRTVRRLLGDQPAGGPVVIREPYTGDLGWVVQRHSELYAQEYRWDRSFEALVAKIVAQFGDQHDPECERAWIAEVDGRPVGSVFCMRKAARTAQLRLLLVEPDARGMGVGSRLVDECVAFARSAQYDVLTLWTNDLLAGARRIYQRAGFQIIEEERHHSFGHDLVGQYWSLPLSS